MFDQPTAPGARNTGSNDPFDQPGAPTGPPPQVVEQNKSRIMPHPITGKPTKFPRASGFAISDEYTLIEWKIAMSVLGIGKHHDLYALANAAKVPQERMEFREAGWWKRFAELGHMAMDRIGASAGAHLGTAFHEWKEEYEAGHIVMENIAEDWQAHMDNFLRMHKASRLKYIEKYTERLVVNLKLGTNGVCGRLDNLREDAFGRLVVDDTKTGKSAPKGADEIAIQLSIYANADFIWWPDHPDAVNGYIPMPENVRKDVGTISWVPINDPDNSAIIPLDLEWGWEAAMACSWLRKYWNRAKRKNDGLILPLAALYDGPAMHRESHVSRFDIVAQIDACRTLDELSQVVMEAAYDDRWSPALQRIALKKKTEIKGAK